MSKDSVKKSPDFGDNLKELRESLGLKQKEAANKFGVTPTTYRNWEKGRSQPQQFSKDQVLDMLRGAAQDRDAIYATVASAGHGSFEIKEDPIGYISGEDALSRPGRDVYWVPVRGDSMDDTLQKNTLVPILKMDDPKLRQDDVYLFRLEDAVQIKRLQRIEGNRILMISDNDLYDNRTLALDEGIDFEILGRVLV